MYSHEKLFLCSPKCYFCVYFPCCFATQEINTKITLSWALKQFITRVHTLFSIYIMNCLPVLPSHQRQSKLPCEIRLFLSSAGWISTTHNIFMSIPDSKVHGANMGPIWGRQDPDGPHAGPMNFVIWVDNVWYKYIFSFHQNNSTCTAIQIPKQVKHIWCTQLSYLIPTDIWNLAWWEKY